MQQSVARREMDLLNFHIKKKKKKTFPETPPRGASTPRAAAPREKKERLNNKPTMTGAEVPRVTARMG